MSAELKTICAGLESTYVLPVKRFRRVVKDRTRNRPSKLGQNTDRGNGQEEVVVVVQSKSPDGVNDLRE
jgi:hypothetical protein